MAFVGAGMQTYYSREATSQARACSHLVTAARVKYPIACCGVFDFTYPKDSQFANREGECTGDYIFGDKVCHNLDAVGCGIAEGILWENS